MTSEKSEQVISFLKSQYEVEDSQPVDEFEFIKVFIEEQTWNENSELISRILIGETHEEDENYIEEKLGSLTHKMDNRSAVEYGEELVRGWIIEDLILEEFNSLGIPVKLSGEDKNREFLEQTTSDADLVTEVDGEITHIEVVSDYTGFWQRSGDADLRDNKYNKLQEHENTIILGIDFDSNEVFAVDPEEINGEYMEVHPVWHKPAYRLDVSDVAFTSMEEVGQKMKQILEI